MKYLVYLMISIVGISVYALNISVDEGDIADVGNIIMSPYALVKGNIQFKVGNITWHPQEIWIVPLGSKPDFFKSAGNSNELPANATGLGKCTTNVYYNLTLGYAYKITSSNINKGSFCAAISSGSYEVFAK